MSTDSSAIENSRTVEPGPRTFKVPLGLSAKMRAKGVDKLTIDEINEEIAAYLREKSQSG